MSDPTSDDDRALPPPEAPAAPAEPPAAKRKRGCLRRLLVPVAILALILCSLAWVEIRSSRIQARLFSSWAAGMTYTLAPGPSEAIAFPAPGPYDARLGYSRLGGFIERLREAGYVVEAQAVGSEPLLDAGRLGLFPPYEEKTQAGLHILDRDGRPLFEGRFPERVYDRFEAIPQLVVDTLLFIENRELLEPGGPYRNPAIEWDRLARAVFDRGVQPLSGEGKVAGGSTLATQREKFRHSPEGRTHSSREKLRQMLSASLRAYRAGPETGQARRAIVLDYVNSIPLAAIPGHGEVIGLGDGLWAWYGLELSELARLLGPVGPNQPPFDPSARARAYKQLLSLFLAHRRPSYYLWTGRRDLRALADGHLRRLAAAGVIPAELRDAALSIELELNQRAPAAPPPPFAALKSANVVRARLLPLLDLERVYDLDRLDLRVATTLDGPAQTSVSRRLRELRERPKAAAAGLVGHRLLAEDEAQDVIYSFTLYERVGSANLLRVQADNFDGLLNINEGVKLELGSTAKLRTLVSYLEIVAALYREHAGKSAEELAAIQVAGSDHLTRWAIEYLRAGERTLDGMLDAALDRRYSASPAEAFFTGGGRHQFSNFKREDDSRVMAVREAFDHSVNLVFIRMMRDIVQYYMFRVPGSSAMIMEDRAHPERQAYLSRFAEREGREFVGRFWRKYRGREAGEILDLLLSDVRQTPRRIAVVFRSLRREALVDELATLLAERLPGSALSDRAVRELWEASDPERLDLVDRGFTARVHPLELWVAAYLTEHPSATREEVVDASVAERQAVYGWLFTTRHKRAQDVRIRTLLEVEAFLEIHRAWKRHGYPFSSLVPSYATAIGSSADRPAALAELVGIIANGGMRWPTLRVVGLHFAQGTPYETVMRREVPPSGERVLEPEVAAVLRRALVGVVERGTATRVRGAFVSGDGQRLDVGGKTGTGDNRFEVWGPGGRLIEQRAINRTATFVFLVGDRFFGTVTAYVPGPDSARFSFTSSLPVQVLKDLAPRLMPLLEGRAVTRTGPGGLPGSGDDEPYIVP